MIDGNDIYFATYTSSRKVAHYRTNSKACVYFLEKGRNFSGVEIKGDMTVLTDPDYCILKFTGFEAQWFTNQRTETVKF